MAASGSLWAALPEVKGHLRLPNKFADALCRFLDPYEQAVFFQLYRLSHGFNKDNCEIGLPKLAERSNMGENTAQRTVKRLETKGLVKKMGYRMGKGIEQGTLYWVAGEGSLTAPASLAAPAPNKNNDLKDNSKGGARQRKDYSACPDCGGRGLWYPGGYEKGVAKCRHERMTA